MLRQFGTSDQPPTRAAEWRVEVTRSTMTPPAPIRLGSRLREVARFAGREVVTDSVRRSLARLAERLAVAD